MVPLVVVLDMTEAFLGAEGTTDTTEAFLPEEAPMLRAPDDDRLGLRSLYSVSGPISSCSGVAAGIGVDSLDISPTLALVSI